ncbi:hypothetical protein PILCRDRAFT_529417 [Piloderma croceum F 1598]|uniref:Uncharacterized protein n=1 Tax=Piloderma croceum (strain F 1598) TaxID=765440 RepID=A0A0C3BTR0_PILCF|nr:hypothetical protein PILCRDRAFT_529417 [Piloderma croceum F 1598]
MSCLTFSSPLPNYFLPACGPAHRRTIMLRHMYCSVYFVNVACVFPFRLEHSELYSPDLLIIRVAGMRVSQIRMALQSGSANHYCDTSRTDPTYRYWLAISVS